jgi:hypothetical protein
MESTKKKSSCYLDEPKAKVSKSKNKGKGLDQRRANKEISVFINRKRRICLILEYETNSSFDRDSTK